jgi:Flp pilus assembly pilin Flp
VEGEVGGVIYYFRLCAFLSRDDGITVVEYIALAAIVLVMLAAIVAVVNGASDKIGEAIADSFDQQIKTWR